MNGFKIYFAGILLCAAVAGGEAADFGDGVWVNEGPYSLAAARGKVVVLYFFEKG